MEITIITQSDLGVAEAEETGLSFVENALIKARNAAKHTGLPALADDSGLEVDYLNGAPGVFSARYAGHQRNSIDNMKKLLFELDKIKNRNARFRTVISFIMNGSETLFEGIVEGQIIKEPRGRLGFGYDPVFQPNGYTISFAEMELNEKNEISHRGRAFTKLINFLNNTGA